MSAHEERHYKALDDALEVLGIDGGSFSEDHFEEALGVVSEGFKPVPSTNVIELLEQAKQQAREAVGEKAWYLFGKDIREALVAKEALWLLQGSDIDPRTVAAGLSQYAG